MLAAAKVAEWFLTKNRADAEGCSDDYLTPMQLQKLLFFAQGYYLGCYGKPLFSDDIKAWDHGPVVPSVYNRYSVFGGRGIDVMYDCSDSDFTEEELRAMKIVYKIYSKYSGNALRGITHIAGSPWSQTARNEVISLDKIYRYYEDAMMSEEEENELDGLMKQAEAIPDEPYRREDFL